MGMGMALGGYIAPGGYMAKGGAVATVVMLSAGLSDAVSFFVDAKVALVSSLCNSLVVSSGFVAFKLETSLVDLMPLVSLPAASVDVISLDVSPGVSAVKVVLLESRCSNSSDPDEYGLQDEKEVVEALGLAKLDGASSLLGLGVRLRPNLVKGQGGLLD